MILSKQHYTFFLIIPPGLEELAKKELLEKSQLIDIEAPLDLILESGGIEFKSQLLDGLKLNYYLKIPTRILLRIDSFKCRDFPKLFKKSCKYPWNNYLNNTDFQISASSKKSRLINTSRIEKTITDGINQYFKANTPSKKMQEKILTFIPTVYIRILDDIVTLSIDTTGDRLNIRSYRTHIGDAPIRENLSSAMIYALSDYKCTRLIDPMCGSGTNLLEAACFYSINQRNFLFESFNITQEYPPFIPKEYFTEMTYSTYEGYDLENKNIEACQENYNQLSTQVPISFNQADLFENEHKGNDEDTAIVVNPPYGKRIKVSDNLPHYFETILFFLKQKFSPKVIGIIIPSDISYQKLNLNNYQLRKIYKFKNGGIRVNYLVIEKH